VALDQIRPDAVVVSNPTSMHVPTALAAVRAGAHVFLEKPVSHTLDGLPELALEADSLHRVVAVGYQLREHPTIVRLLERLAEPARSLGRITWIRVSVGEHLPDWHPWEDFRTSYAARRDLGGGALLTFSHELDLLRALGGEVESVAGAIAQGAASWDIDVDTLSTGIVQFVSGAVGEIHLDLLGRPPHRIAEIACEHGHLRWDGVTGVLEIRSADGSVTLEEPPPGFERNMMFLQELRRFLQACRGQGRPAVTLDDAVRTLCLALALRRAAERGQAVRLTEMPTSCAGVTR